MSAPATPVFHLTGLPGIGLDAVQQHADLQRRFDRKHLVGEEVLAALLSALAPRMHVLEVDGARSTPYTSTYFDTPDLRTFRDHRQGRRRRFKVRTRHYGDPTGTVLELKRKGLRGQTVKHRWPHPSPAHDDLDVAARELLDDALRATYGLSLPTELDAVAVTRFDRTTLVDPVAGERVTVDAGLVIEVAGTRHALGQHQLIVETKSATRGGGAAATLTALGVRPLPVSKYGMGISVAHPHLSGAAWRPALRRLTTPPAATASA